MTDADVSRYERMKRMLAAVEAPVVQLWAWPGSGRRAFLEQLLDEPATGFVTRADLGDAGALERRVEELRQSGTRRWLAEAGTAAEVDHAAALLFPGEHLWVSTPLRMTLEAPTHATAPSDWMLTRDETRALWRERTGEELDEDELSRWHEASGGWWELLRLWAALPARERSPLPEAEERLREVAQGFFRDRVSDVVADFEAAGVGLPRPLRRYRARGSADAPAVSGASEIVMRLLGVPQVSGRCADGSLREVRFPYRRPLQMLAYLAVANRLVPRDELVEALWSDASEDAVRRNFHPTVSRLRRVLRSAAAGTGEVVRLEAGAYRLDPELGWSVDCLEVQRLDDAGAEAAEAGDDGEAARLWRDAWLLYSGSFMEGHEDGWIGAIRSRLQDRYLRLLRRLGERYLMMQDWSAAEDVLRTLVLEDPLEERAHVSLMKALGGRGRRDLVNRQYERLRTILLTELGVEPSEETLSAYNDLLG